MSFAVISYPSLVLCQAHDIDRHAARFDGWFFHEADARAVYERWVEDHPLWNHAIVQSTDKTFAGD
jgi:hypothetical protein